MRFFRFIHRWFSVFAAFFIIMFALSGIVLNHRNFFSPISVNRNYLPKDYHYGNWNFSSLKSATNISSDSLLIFGNIGVWLTDNEFTFFESYNQGFNKGIDNRRTYQILHTPEGNTYAATQSGLYYLNDHQWHLVSLPVEEKLVRSITMKGETLCVLTRSHLLLGNDQPQKPGFTAHTLPQPEGYSENTSLFRALWVIHSGEILGLPGKILVDALGIVLIFLCITGIIWFIAPDLMKAIKKKIRVRKKLVKINRFSLRWHKLIGIVAVSFLLITTLTGVFLRPPLLIAIINSEVSNIKGTILDNPNPWHDKLRDIQYDELEGNFIISTSEGFFKCDTMLRGPLRAMQTQPPVSIMGINVFKQTSPGKFITGSFSGIFSWAPSGNEAFDLITGQPVRTSRGIVNPFGTIPVAGYINLLNDKEILFDYNAGVLLLSGEASFPEMPDKIKKQSPISLWNLALEIHTGRFYSFVLGKFYILFIPVAGIIIFSILISGIVLWAKKYRKKKFKEGNSN